MRKGIIIVILGVFIVGTVLICTGKGKIAYEKKENFQTINEVVDTLNSGVLCAYDRNSFDNLVYSNDFKECLSKRKRISIPGISFSSMNIEVDQSRNNDQEKQNILNDYFARTNKLKKYKKPIKYEAVPFVGTANINAFDKSIPEDIININMNIVFIDEGEGWVVDYFVYSDDTTARDKV